MRPSTYAPISEANDSTPADTSTVKTLSPAERSSACLLSVETTNARMTFDGTTPSATNGHVIPKDQFPQLILLGPGATIKWIALTAAVSKVNVTWLA